MIHRNYATYNNYDTYLSLDEKKLRSVIGLLQYLQIENPEKFDEFFKIRIEQDYINDEIKIHSEIVTDD